MTTSAHCAACTAPATPPWMRVSSAERAFPCLQLTKPSLFVGCLQFLYRVPITTFKLRSRADMTVEENTAAAAPMLEVAPRVWAGTELQFWATHTSATQQRCRIRARPAGVQDPPRQEAPASEGLRFALCLLLPVLGKRVPSRPKCKCREMKSPMHLDSKSRNNGTSSVQAALAAQM